MRINPVPLGEWGRADTAAYYWENSGKQKQPSRHARQRNFVKTRTGGGRKRPQGDKGQDLRGKEKILMAGGR